MVLLSGLIYDPKLPERFYEGSIRLEAGQVAGEESGTPDFEGIIVPLLCDAHTHLADGFIMDCLPIKLEDAVAEPWGIKHVCLEKASSENLEESFKKGLWTLRNEGVGVVCDFREGGRKGIEDVKKATCSNDNSRTLLLGRPTSTSSHHDVLDVSDGIGLCSIVGMQKGVVEEISSDCRYQKKLFAFHHAEDSREPLAPVLEASPDFIVHATLCTRDEMKDIVSADIGIVVCPTMNAFFGNFSPIRDMLDSGATVALGTDNAMHMRPSMFETMSAAYMLSRLNRKPLTPNEIMDMCISGAKKILCHDMPTVIEKGQPASLMVLERPEGCTEKNVANVVVTKTRDRNVLFKTMR